VLSIRQIPYPAVVGRLSRIMCGCIFAKSHVSAKKGVSMNELRRILANLGCSHSGSLRLVIENDTSTQAPFLDLAPKHDLHGSCMKRADSLNK